MIKNIISYSPVSFSVMMVTLVSFIGVVSVICMSQVQATGTQNTDEKLITIHDRNQEKVIVTRASTVQRALDEAKIALDSNDSIEPALDKELIESSYNINIYRARPVVVTDGIVRQKIMTAQQTADKIAEDAGLEVRDEDKTTLKPIDDIVSEGAALELLIDRATELTLQLYGKQTTIYTQAATVRQMLQSKKITLGLNDHVSVPLDAQITEGMSVALWRNGKQTITDEKEIPFGYEKVYDAARPVGFREVQTVGVVGKQSVTYEIDMHNGRETARSEIQRVTTLEPKKQIEVIGIKPGNGLSRSKGAHVFTDSRGVSHRETYYDLLMNVVMKNCGAQGQYTVRPDGVKVDKDGYVIIAAHLGNYPRCSVVETSLGPGKVYDTGSFTSKHPHGFDLATDWTNNDGR